MQWWSPPKQRQRWGDVQILPTGNWGQIFFDLFYVAGCINLGNVLKDAESGSYLKSILYFCGVGFPAIMLWFDRMHYDARFTTRPGHDVVHRVLELLQVGFVATALSRIRSVEVLSNTCQHADMFEFSLCLVLYSLVTLGRYIEVMCCGVGDQASRVAARRDFQWRLLPTLFLQVSAVLSGRSYFSEDCEGLHDRAIYFCLASWISWALIGYWFIVTPKARAVDLTVPMNIHFCIHRYGEWFMLMFGESIISLLIVDGHNESVNYSVAFFSGILSIIFLAHLHYGGEPQSPDQHALSRSRHSSYLYTIMVPIYSGALIALGASYKMFLYEFTRKYGYDGDRRLGGGGGEEGEESSGEYQEIRQQHAANLFSGSIAAVLVCLDLKQMLHKGLPEMKRIAEKVSRTKVVVFVLLKFLLVVFLATLCLYQNDPHVMAFCGLGAIIFQELLKNIFFRRGGEADWKPDVFDDDDDSTTLFSIGSTANMSTSPDDQVFALFERQMLETSLSTWRLDEPVRVVSSAKEVEMQNSEDSEDSEWGGLDYSRMAEI